MRKGLEVICRARSGRIGQEPTSVSHHAIATQGWENVPCLEGVCCWPAGNDGSLRIWNVAKGACTLVVKQHSAEVTSAVWLPDGERIITGSHDKNMVRP